MSQPTLSTLPLNFDPRFMPWERLSNMVGPLLQSGDRDAALSCALASCALLGPTRSEPWTSLAGACDTPALATKQEAAARMAISIRDTDQLAWHNLSLSLMRQWKIDEALTAAQVSHHLDISNPHLFLHAATLLSISRNFPEAIALMTAAISLFNQLHVLTTVDNQPAISPEEYRQAMYQSHTARGIMALESGDLTAYFDDLAMRADYMPLGSILQIAAHQGRLWQPFFTVEEKVVVYLEGGLGDQIQYARLLRRFRDMNPNIVALAVICSTPLMELVKGMDCVDGVVDRESESGVAAQRWYLERADYTFVGSMDLPEWSELRQLCGRGASDSDTSLAPAHDPFGKWAGPYLRPSTKTLWEPRLTPGKTAVAFVWKGNPKFAFEWMREFPLESFLAWAEPRRDTCTFHSFQLEDTNPANNVQFPDWVEAGCAGPAGDMAETAARLKKTHVLVARDTGIVHLAGAMGHPTVLLHPWRKDWRWTLPYPLYGPNMVHVGQDRPGDWGSAFGKLPNALNQALDIQEQVELMGAMATR